MKNRFTFLRGFLIFILLLGISPKTVPLKAAAEKSESIDKEIIQKSFYILGPDDEIKIKFYGIPDMSGIFKIMSDGHIQLPIIGNQYLSGYTLDQVKKKLTALYKKEILTPQIDLELIKPRALKVSVVGEILRPGSYTLGNIENSQVKNSGALSIKGLPTVVDAIQKAGGLTFDADITNVFIYRVLPGNTMEFKKARLNLFDLIKTGNQANNPILFDGDVIEIARINDEIKSIENLPTNLTPETIKIYVVGEVSLPGMIEVASNTKINQAILIAGGPNNWRYKNKVELLRVRRNGSVQVKKFDFNSQKKINKKNKFSLRDGDIIKVNKNLFAKSTDVLGTVMGPVSDAYTLYGITKILNND